MKARYALLATLGLGLALTLALLWALGGPPVARAQPPWGRGVAPGGNCGPSPPGPCYASVQDAVDAAVTGDEILIATGVYTGVQARAGVTQVVIITKTLTLRGGYTTTNWTTSDPNANPTTLDAEGQGRVVYITADVTPTVEGLHITGGDGSTGGDGNGGGVAIREATAIIRYNVISDNVGGRLLNVGGDGGGIYVVTTTSPVLIYSNTIQANVGYSGVLTSSIVAGGGLGGGIAVFAGSAVITGNQILSNTAAQTDIPSSAARGYGGGIGSVFADALTIEDNTIQGNLGVASGLRGFGGGIMSYGTPVLTIADNTVIENTAIISGADAAGGGMWLSEASTMTLTGNWVISNTAGVTLTANPSSYPNPWAGGGGIRIYGGSTANDILTMQDNHLIGNVTARTMTTSGTSRGHVDGGGLNVERITTTLIISNEVRGNTAVENLSLSGSPPGDTWGGRPAGGGMYLSDNDTVTLSDNEVRDNVTAKQQVVNGVESRSEGGGIALSNVENANVSNNTVSANTAVITGSITSNTGERYNADGGGIRVNCWDKPGCTLSFAGNDISNNTAAYTVTVSGSDAEGQANGGGLCIRDVPNVSFNGDTVSNNTALGFGSASGPNNHIDAGGGGINIDGHDALNDSVTVQDSHVIGNVAAGTMTTSGTDSMGHAEGGGLVIRNITTTLIISNEVRGNTAVENLSLSGSGGWGGRPSGGGMFLGENDTVTLSGNEVRDNVTAVQQVVNGVSSNSEGGGITLSNVENATVSNNKVSNNTAVVTGSITSDTGENYDPHGGGIMVGCKDRPSCNLSLAGNNISNNTTAYTITVGGTNAGGRASGGGLSISDVPNVSFSGDTISDNTALGFGSASGPNNHIDAGGGGINIDGHDALNDSVTVQDSHVIGNVAAGTMTASGTNSMGHAQGGGLVIRNITTTLIISNEVRGNIAVENLSLSGSGGWGGRPSGGGMYLSENYTVTLSGNEVRDNVTAKQQVVNGVDSGSEGGGIALINVENATVSSNTVSGNAAMITGSITCDACEDFNGIGGGIMTGCWDKPSCSLSFVGNDILNNVAAHTVIVSGTNTNGGGGGGGIRLSQSTAILQSNVISGNTGNLAGDGWGGGMEAADESTVTMEGNLILGNRMNPTYSGGSGGVWVWQSTLTSTNDVFGRNYDGIGGADDGTMSTLTLINDTLYDNGFTGVSVHDSSTVYVTNTIVYSHSEGLSKHGSATLIGGYNLLSNTTNYAGGLVPGTNDITDEDPLFLDAPNDDFHIASDSPAVDAGTDAGAPSVDFEGDTRPQGSGVDIGADEAAGQDIYLPIIMKNY